MGLIGNKNNVLLRIYGKYILPTLRVCCRFETMYYYCDISTLRNMVACSTKTKHKRSGSEGKM